MRALVKFCHPVDPCSCTICDVAEHDHSWFADMVAVSRSLSLSKAMAFSKAPRFPGREFSTPTTRTPAPGFLEYSHTRLDRPDLLTHRDFESRRRGWPR